jgi:hypothetical protein
MLCASNGSANPKLSAMNKLFTLTFLICVIAPGICLPQRSLISIEDTTGATECYLNDTLIRKVKPLLEDALKIMNLLRDKNYTELQKEFKNTFANGSYTTKELKKKTDWSSALITKYGIPENNKIKFHCCVPISWFLANKKEDNGMVIEYSFDFKFEYPDDEVKGKNNIIEVSYGRSSSKSNNHFTRMAISFDDAKQKNVIQEMIDEFGANDKKN